VFKAEINMSTTYFVMITCVDRIILRKGTFVREFPTTGKLALPDSGNNVIAGPKEMFTAIMTEMLGQASFMYSRNKFTVGSLLNSSCSIIPLIFPL
jgi:hypothetical protein